MNVKYITLGCKVNQYETEAIRELFNRSGYTDFENIKADIIVINTCSVTAQSDKKAGQTLRRCRKENPQAVIILTGCMVQAFPERSESLKEADIVIGNTDISKILSETEKFLKTKLRIFSVDSHKATDVYNTPLISNFSERTRAYMKIEDGCDRFCTYCIIPYAKGRVRSRSLDEIKKEAEMLALNGFSEIVLVGINLSSYGKGENFDLADAVDSVCKTEGIKRVRLGSLEPDCISDEMLKRLKAQEKFCPQFHLSLQSGCDETLKRMNRHYDSKFYEDLVTRIRNMFDDAAVTTDIMVGFAGESDEEFEKSLSFVKKIGFARSHIFPYSIRKGTPAEKYPDQIKKEIKALRAKKLAEICIKSEEEFLNKLCGRSFDVLFESKKGNTYEGYTANYSKVFVKSDEDLRGKILSVKITEAFSDHCTGIL